MGGTLSNKQITNTKIDENNISSLQLEWREELAKQANIHQTRKMRELNYEQNSHIYKSDLEKSSKKKLKTYYEFYDELWL